MADDKKNVMPEEQPKAESSPPDKKEPDKATPEQPTVAPEGKGRPGNVIEITGDMLDKIAAQKTAAAIENAKTSGQEKAPEDKPKEPEQPKRQGRSTKKEPVKEAASVKKNKAAQKPAPEKKTEKAAPAGKAGKTAKAPKAAKGTQEVKAPAQPEPPAPVEAPRPQKEEQIVYLKLSDLHAFKNHPFQVRNDEEMRAMVSSVKDKGVTQPAIVRPREDGGYEIVSGHRRQKASELAGFTDMPCIIRNLTDEQAITQMVEDNTNQRENILPSERAKALKMQLEAIKHQGARETSGQIDPKDAGKRSNEIVAERNKMTVKQVQRYIKLNDLVPDLTKMMDEGKIKFTPAVELSYIKPKNQRYIAVAIESQQSSPSLSQAQRMRELDQKGILNGDVIDGIMMEDKKEVDKVILTGAELSKYFGKEATPREMKDQIIKLLDDWKGQQKEVAKPEKKAAQPEK